MALRSCSEGIDLGGGVWVRAQTKGLRPGTAVTRLLSDCKFWIMLLIYQVSNKLRACLPGEFNYSKDTANW